MRYARRLFSGELRPAIVHSLAGRLRIQLPVLRRIPARHRPVLEARLRRARLPVGVDRIQANLTTASILVRYDPSRLDEAQVLAWLDSLARTARHALNGLLDIAPERRAGAAAILGRHVEAALDAGVPLGPELLESHRDRPA